MPRTVPLQAAALTAIGIATLTAALTASAPAAQAALAEPAHAALVSSQPADGTVVPREPSQVTATFDQPVAITPASLEVYCPDGSRADAGGTIHQGADTIAVDLMPSLGNGTYTATWHVISADTHPVQGAFTFSIGAPSATHVGAILPSASRLVGTVYAIVRWFGYAFFAILGGAVLFLIICWPDGARRKGASRLIVTGAAGLFCATVLALLMQGPYGVNEGIGQILQPSLVSSTLHSRLGLALQAREVLCVLAGGLASFAVPRLPAAGPRARAAAALAWVALITAIAATWAASDHASTGIQVPLALPADIVHLDAMAVWIGGLIMMAGFALRGPATAAVAAAVPRFSAIALGCVTMIVASGVYQTWRQVGTWAALADTAYGRLILAKITGMCMLIGLGYAARRLIKHGLLPPSAEAAPLLTAAPAAGGVTGAALAPAGTVGAGMPPAIRPGGPGSLPAAPVATMRRLRTSVTIELIIAAAILGFTSVLVNTQTGREAYAPPVSTSAHFNTGGPGGTGTVHVFITPARLGPNTVEVYFVNAAGRSYVPAQVQAALYFPAKDLGPLPVTLTRTAPGQYRTTRATVTFTGTWQLQVTVRSDAFDETTVYLPVAVH